MEKIKKTCETCRFSEILKNSEHWSHACECRKDPPTVFRHNNVKEGWAARFPRLSLDCWCGCWQPKETEEKEESDVVSDNEACMPVL